MIDCTEEKPHHIPHKIASLAKKCKSKMNVDKLTGNPSRAMGMVFTDTLLWHCCFSASHKHILGGFPSSNNTSSYSILLRLLETWPERLLRRRDGTLILLVICSILNPKVASTFMRAVKFVTSQGTPTGHRIHPVIRRRIIFHFGGPNMS